MSSSELFHTLSEAICWILLNNLKTLLIYHLLDNFPVISSNTSPPVFSLGTLASVFSFFGVSLFKEKAQVPLYICWVSLNYTSFSQIFFVFTSSRKSTFQIYAIIAAPIPCGCTYRHNNLRHLQCSIHHAIHASPHMALHAANIPVHFRAVADFLSQFFPEVKKGGPSYKTPPCMGSSIWHWRSTCKSC